MCQEIIPFSRAVFASLSAGLNACLYTVSDAFVKISLACVCFGVDVGGLEEAALEGTGVETLEAIGVAALELGELVALEDAEVLEDLGAMLSGVELGKFMRVVSFLWFQMPHWRHFIRTGVSSRKRNTMPISS